jgi:hypothetical protein
MESSTLSQTEMVISLLTTCPGLTKLALRFTGSLDKSVIPSFAYLPELKQLTITNCAPDDQLPLYATFVFVIGDVRWADLPPFQERETRRLHRGYHSCLRVPFFEQHLAVQNACS